MSAGTGITHSEYNSSKSEPVHFLQIWIVPETRGLPPSYEQKQFPAEERRNRFRLVGDRDSAEGAVTIHQDVRLYVADLEPGRSLTWQIPAGRRAWLQVVRGIVELEGDAIREGDGAAITEERSIELKSDVGSELLLFDLA